MFDPHQKTLVDRFFLQEVGVSFDCRKRLSDQFYHGRLLNDPIIRNANTIGHYDRLHHPLEAVV